VNVAKFPLSFNQERLWLAQQIDPRSVVYNMADIFHLSGYLDVVALSFAVSYLVRRHEILRTNFHEDDGLPFQVIGQGTDGFFSLTDLSSGTRENNGSRLRALIESASSTPFNLANDRLFRAEVACLGNRDYVLILAMHHIVSDGRSVAIMLSELSAMYNAIISGGHPALPDVPIQYVDFACWQRGELASIKLGKQREYWIRKISAPPFTATLPGGGIAKKDKSEAAGLVEFHLTESELTPLETLATRFGCTLFMVLFAIFLLLVSQWTGQQDLLVGVLAAGRTEIDTENMVGFFVNTLAVRTDISGDPSFHEILKRVRRTLTEAYDNQDMPFDQLVNAVRAPRAPGMNPLVQIAFQMLSDDIIGRLEFVDVEAARIPVRYNHIPFHVFLEFIHQETSLIGRLYYRKNQYDDEAMRHIVARFQDVEVGALHDPDRRVSDFAAPRR
jgi:hypothetical protein